MSQQVVNVCLKVAAAGTWAGMAALRFLVSAMMESLYGMLAWSLSPSLSSRVSTSELELGQMTPKASPAS